MTSDIERKRQQVAGAYSGDAWKQKVKNMSENQVIAIFMSLKAQKKL